jgi:hypothetical protein
LAAEDRTEVSELPQGFEIPSLDRDHRCIASGPLFCLVWQGELTETIVLQLARDLETYAEDHRRGFAFVLLVESSAGLPSESVRLLLGSVLHRAMEAGRVTSVAVVLESFGFAAAAHRGALQPVLLRTGAGSLARICTSLADAIAFSGDRLLERAIHFDAMRTHNMLEMGRQVRPRTLLPLRSVG